MDNGTILQNYKDRQKNNNSYKYLQVVKLSLRTGRLLLMHCLVTTTTTTKFYLQILSIVTFVERSRKKQSLSRREAREISFKFLF